MSITADTCALCFVRSKSRRKYIFSRLFSNAVCGGAANALPLAVFALIMLIFVTRMSRTDTQRLNRRKYIAAVRKRRGRARLGRGYNPARVPLRCRVGVIGTALSAAVPNRYVALCGPFVLFFLMHLIASALQKKNSARPTPSCPIFCRRSASLFLYQAVLLVLGCAAFIFLRAKEAAAMKQCLSVMRWQFGTWLGSARGLLRLFSSAPPLRCSIP